MFIEFILFTKFIPFHHLSMKQRLIIYFIYVLKAKFYIYTNNYEIIIDFQTKHQCLRYFNKKFVKYHIS